MALGATMRRRVQVMVERHVSAPETKARVAAYARGSVAELVRSGAASPVWTRFVDGKRDAPEESVRLDGGSISYLFGRLSAAAAFALAYAVQRSPQQSGAYRQGWFIAIDGKPWTAPLAEIPPGAEVLVVNNLAYHRKIDSGGQRTSVPPGIVEATRQAVQQAFPGLEVNRLFVTLPGGYRLKGRGVESGLTFGKKTGWDRKHAPRTARAKDRRAGSEMTYPAVRISERVR